MSSYEQNYNDPDHGWLYFDTEEEAITVTNRINANRGTLQEPRTSYIQTDTGWAVRIEGAEDRVAAADPVLLASPDRLTLDKTTYAVKRPTQVWAKSLIPVVSEGEVQILKKK